VPKSPCNLLSLGNVNKKGGLYIGFNKKLYVFFVVNGKLVSTSGVLNNSLVHPATVTDGKIFQAASSTEESLFGLLGLYVVDNELLFKIPDNYACFANIDSEIAEKVRKLHINMAHPGLDSMFRSSINGDFGEFSKEDIKVYRNLSHPCSACVSGKWKDSILFLPQSTPQKPTTPGELIVFDLNQLSDRTIEGFTQKLIVVDFFSGYLITVGLKTKEKLDVFNAIKSVIAASFTARGWVVSGTVCDSESVFTSLVIHLSEIGVSPTFSPPGMHAKLVERYIQTANNRSGSLIHSLPFIVPPKLLFMLFQYVVRCVNLLANKRTSNMSGKNKNKSPRDIVTKFLLPPFKGLSVCFGDVALVQTGAGHRNEIRKTLHYPRQFVEKASPGIVVGISESLSQYLFLMDNGQIIHRGSCSLVRNALPPGWKVKTGGISLLDYSDKTCQATEETLALTPEMSIEIVDDEDETDQLSDSTVVTYEKETDRLPDETTVISPSANETSVGVTTTLSVLSSGDLCNPNNVSLTEVNDINNDTNSGNISHPEVVPSLVETSDYPSILSPAPLLKDHNVGVITDVLCSYYLPFYEGGKYFRGMKKFVTDWKDYTRVDGSFDKTAAELKSLGWTMSELNKLPSKSLYETQKNLTPGSLSIKCPLAANIVPDTEVRPSRNRKPNQSLAKAALEELYSELLHVDPSSDAVRKVPEPINYVEIPDKFFPDFEKLFAEMEKFNANSTANYSNSTFLSKHPSLPVDPESVAETCHNLKYKKRAVSNSERMRIHRGSSPSGRRDLAFAAVLEALEDIESDDSFLQAVKSSDTNGVHSLASAIKFSRTMAGAAVVIEMDKMSRLNVFTEVFEHLLELGVVIMDAVSVFKVKTDPKDGSPSKMTYRLAVNGKQQPLDTYDETYAATSSQTFASLARASFYAWAVENNIVNEVFCSDLDISGAFLHADYVSTVDTALYMRLPKHLPGVKDKELHPLAGKIVKLNKALYGLPEANMLFEKERNIIIRACKFISGTVDVSIFVKIDPNNSLLRSLLITTVDDFQIFSTCPGHWTDLKKNLSTRFGELSINEISTQHAGITHEAFPDGSFCSSQSGYIKKFCEELGVNKLLNPFSPVPSDIYLFDESSDTTPVTQKFYQKLIGTLIYCLNTRHDVRKEVIYLASKSAAPTIGDLIKVTRVFRYLNFTADTGPRFFANGAILFGFCDAAWANHTDFRSHVGYFGCIGRDSAPFASHSSKIKSCVALSSMEAEYISLCELVKFIVVCRRFLSEIGFPQPGPTTIFEDNQSAIKLAVAPSVGSRSKHILLRYHYTKAAIESGEVVLEYVDTLNQRADSLTKVQTKPSFLGSVGQLLNLKK
jgi:Reverse transcriptase (RNA-dependent DNA polymerase)